MNLESGEDNRAVSIVDYGMGNIKSVRNALEYLEIDYRVVDDPKDLSEGKMIVPGVGAFGDAMRNLEGFLPRIEENLASGFSLLGICLGLQVLFENSEEDPEVDGFGLLRGEVRKIDTELKLPQIGWNYLEIKNDKCPLFEGVEGGYVYYANTYHAVPEEDVTVAKSDYQADVTASVWKDNIFGMQFHPEKSGRYGLKLLENFEEV